MRMGLLAVLFSYYTVYTNKSLGCTNGPVCPLLPVVAVLLSCLQLFGFTGPIFAEKKND